MIATDDERRFISLWRCKCESAFAIASRCSARCGGEFSEIIRSRTAEFCELATPLTSGQFDMRQSEFLTLSHFIESIACAANAAIRRPHLASQIIEATRKFNSAAVLNCDSLNICFDFTQAIADLCVPDRKMTSESG